MSTIGKLLIVEDDVALAEYLRELLKTYFEIKVANDGQEGYELACSYHPDCIISDVRMPRLSGIDMLKMIRRTPGLETTGVILLSVLSEVEDRILGYESLADLYFPKPFDAQELVVSTVGLVRMRRRMRVSLEGDESPSPEPEDKN